MSKRRKKELLYFVLLFLTIAVLYFGMVGFCVTFCFTMDIWVMRLQAFISMILSGVVGYFIFKPIIYKKFNHTQLLFIETIIMAVVVANVFKAFVSDFSLGYTSLIIASIYMLYKD